MQKRENLLYVGIDRHKETHTAVMVNIVYGMMKNKTEYWQKIREEEQ